MRWRFGKRILLVCIALVAVAAGLYVVAGVNRIDSDAGTAFLLCILLTLAAPVRRHPYFA